MSTQKRIQEVSQKESDASTAAAQSPETAHVTGADFPTVGIGASAGGLEALEEFLAEAPADGGMAYVIIQHLDPTRAGMMPELLQRGTAMPVIQATDGTTMQPDQVYVIPPNKDMSVLHGVLYLLEPSAPRGLRLPIDFFLRSLAADQGERSIGVILSGMGSDGTLGLRAIKEKGGIAFVQDPETAKCDGMPGSAIAAGLADVVAPAGKIPAKIMAWRQRKALCGVSEKLIPERSRSALEKAVILLREHAGHDFSHYKHNTLYRRIERRMGIHQIDEIESYIRYLRESPQEMELLFKELLIGVTSFFRDGEVWARLQDDALPSLLARHAAGSPLRAWLPGCSTGEEAYSLAMVLREALDTHRPSGRCVIQVFATDLDGDAIDRARAGLYPENIVTDVPTGRLQRFFTKEAQGYRVCNEIRETVVFATQNLISDPPFTKLDILSCRNLLIYLDPAIQQKLIPLFHYALNPSGLLLLGSAETVGAFSSLFEPVDSKLRLYQSIEPKGHNHPLEFPATFNKRVPNRIEALRHPPPVANLQTLADALILKSYAPASVLVTEKGDILYLSGRTGKYLEPAAGKANWNLFAMAREGIRNELFGAFQKALRKEEGIFVRGLRTEDITEDRAIDIEVMRLEESGALHGLIMIVFHDVPLPEKMQQRGTSASAPGDNSEAALLKRELNEAREDARLHRERMQTTQEELLSANEEMQSTNEEVQSANEELMTSKEEMQSLNEELQTVNVELQLKLDELSRTSNDMKNLLDSTDIATLFLDNELNVRRFTERATAIFNLIEGDLGRPITDLASRLCYPELAEDARAVLRSLLACEKSVRTQDDAWFAVRIMPYRTTENRIDGVVITFADITTSKRLEDSLRGRHAGLEALLAQGKSSKGKPHGS